MSTNYRDYLKRLDNAQLAEELAMTEDQIRLGEKAEEYRQPLLTGMMDDLRFERDEILKEIARRKTKS